MYEERLTDSIPEKYIVEDLRFDSLGRLISERRYYTQDTTAGIQMHNTYNDKGDISHLRWTWIELAETEYANYTYNRKGKLIKVVQYSKKEGNTKYKKTDVLRLKYNKAGELVFAKSKRDKSKLYYTYKGDTCLVENKESGDYFIYKNGVIQKRKFSWGSFDYEYNDQQQLVKFTKRNAPGKLLISQEYTYKNGLLMSMDITQYRLGEVIHTRRTHVYAFE